MVFKGTQEGGEELSNHIQQSWIIEVKVSEADDTESSALQTEGQRKRFNYGSVQQYTTGAKDTCIGPDNRSLHSVM